MDAFVEAVTATVNNPENKTDEVEEDEDAEKKDELTDEQRKLVEMEMWGQQKRWNDIEFVHRMRNMRSQKVYEMSTSHLEKVMER